MAEATVRQEVTGVTLELTVEEFQALRAFMGLLSINTELDNVFDTLYDVEFEQNLYPNPFHAKTVGYNVDVSRRG